MDGDLLLIFGFVLLVSSLALRFATNAHKRSVEHEERKLELLARKAEAEAGGISGGGDYRKLEERVRVLERIATDGNHALATQIESLRELDALEDKSGKEAAQ